MQVTKDRFFSVKKDSKDKKNPKKNPWWYGYKHIEFICDWNVLWLFSAKWCLGKNIVCKLNF